MSEKPLSMDADEAHLMIQTSKKFSTTLLDGMWMRYLPHILKLKEIINERHIGDIQSNMPVMVKIYNGQRTLDCGQKN